MTLENFLLTIKRYCLMHHVLTSKPYTEVMSVSFAGSCTSTNSRVASLCTTQDPQGVSLTCDDDANYHSVTASPANVSLKAHLIHQRHAIAAHPASLHRLKQKHKSLSLSLHALT